MSSRVHVGVGGGGGGSITSTSDTPWPRWQAALAIGAPVALIGAAGIWYYRSKRKVKAKFGAGELSRVEETVSKGSTESNLTTSPIEIVEVYSFI